MAKIIEAPKNYEPIENEVTLFLGGGITSCPNWQQDLIKLLGNTPDLVMYNPRRKNFPIHDPNAAEEQIIWEYNYLKKVDILVFWFSGGSLNPIVLYELGKYLNSSNRYGIIGIDENYGRRQDVEIQTKLSRPDIKIVYSLGDLSVEILNSLKDGSYIF